MKLGVSGEKLKVSSDETFFYLAYKKSMCKGGFPFTHAFFINYLDKDLLGLVHHIIFDKGGHLLYRYFLY